MMCRAHLPRSITFNDTVKLTCIGVHFGGFLRVIREFQIGNDDFKSAVHPAVLGRGVWLFVRVRRFAICSSTVLAWRCKHQILSV